MSIMMMMIFNFFQFNFKLMALTESAYNATTDGVEYYLDYAVYFFEYYETYYS